MAIFKRFWSRLKAKSVRNHHIDKPVDESINRPEKRVNGSFNEPEKPVNGSNDKPEEKTVPEEKPAREKLVEGSPDNPVDGPVSETQFTLEVTVIPVPEGNETPANTISKGLVRLSKGISTMNSLPSVNETSDEISTMASFIINALNIIATLPDRERLERVYSHHVFGTRTGIATYFNLMEIVLNHKPEGWTGGEIMDNIFSAFLCFGMIILRTPVPLSAHIAAAIGVEVKNASSYTSALSDEAASIIAREIIRDVTPNVANPENPARGKIRTPRQTDIRPLVSIFTSDQLAGLARRMAWTVNSRNMQRPEDAARWFKYELLRLRLNVRLLFCPCNEESKNFPICLCDAQSMSQSEYEKECTWKLLPTVI